MLQLHLPASLLLAYATYLVGTASPGPSNLAIMATAMSRGRPHALALTGGVINGSLVWGFSAAFGLSSLMRAYSWSLLLVKLAGGVYMLWLAWKAARVALVPSHLAAAGTVVNGNLRETYLKGLAMHLTNPKSIFVWLSIVALALPQGANRSDALWVVAGCATLGITVFVSYALAFSSEPVRRLYRAAHRWFNATLAAVFLIAGVRMLLTKTSST